jgi:hypothetical protein
MGLEWVPSGERVARPVVVLRRTNAAKSAGCVFISKKEYRLDMAQWPRHELPRNETRLTEWLPASRLVLGLVPRPARVAPRVGIGDRGRWQKKIAVRRDLRHIPYMTAIELENAVQKLPPEELERFAEWFEHFIDNQWDKNFESDVTSGRLDAVAKKADADFEAGHCTPL